jgi:hypothetical protein
VATALIEKPHRGDFLPILDGGFSLQYSPLLECREGDGVLLFCQLDVTGRTEQEPAAEVLSRNMLSYLQSWQPAPRRDVLLAGDPQTRQHLERLGLSPDAYAAEKLTARSLLIVTAAGEQQVARDAAAIGRWLETGGRVLGLGLSGAAAGSFLPVKVETNVGEHIAAYFPPPPARSPLAGICPADVHSPAPRSIPLLASPAGVGNGVLGLARTDQVVFCQLSPADYADDIDQHNVKRTYRRTSFLLSRLLANLGAAGHTPLVERFAGPVSLAVADVPAQPLSDPPQGRWLEGLYLDTPEEWDDPYRFFRW